MPAGLVGAAVEVAGTVPQAHRGLLGQGMEGTGVVVLPAHTGKAACDVGRTGRNGRDRPLIGVCPWADGRSTRAAGRRGSAFSAFRAF